MFPLRTATPDDTSQATLWFGLQGSNYGSGWWPPLHPKPENYLTAWKNESPYGLVRDETLEYLTETASINAYRQNKKEERDRVCADRSVIAAAKKMNLLWLILVLLLQ